MINYAAHITNHTPKQSADSADSHTKNVILTPSSMLCKMQLRFSGEEKLLSGVTTNFSSVAN